jgi:hypothetical protein
VMLFRRDCHVSPCCRSRLCPCGPPPAVDRAEFQDAMRKLWRTTSPGRGSTA